MTVARQKKEWRKIVASVTYYIIPKKERLQQERPALKGKTSLERSCHSISFTPADTHFFLCQYISAMQCYQILVKRLALSVFSESVNVLGYYKRNTSSKDVG